MGGVFFGKRFSSFQIIIAGFLAVILAGTFLIMLPVSSETGHWTSFGTALFTSTSAVCVTGLVVRDTASAWSLFGQAVILVLIQIGGLGIISVTAFIASVSGRRIFLLQRSLLQESFSAHQIGGIVKMTGFIFKAAFILELSGAVMMMPSFCGKYGISGIWMSVFHSVSAFCNAGFDIMGRRTGSFSSLTSFSNSFGIVLPVCLLIVIGRSGARKRHFWSKLSLTEQLVINAPDVDVYIIPDSAADLKHRNQSFHLTGQIRPTLKDTFIMLLLLAAATGLGWSFRLLGFPEANIITVFILGVLIISVVTVSPLYGMPGSLASVLLFNWFFTEPVYSFHIYEAEYVVTFGIMLISSMITGTLANRMKENARQSAREAFRTKVLLDTSQLLQKADHPDAVTRITARQIITLLDRDVVIYPCGENRLPGEGTAYNTTHSVGTGEIRDENEKEITEWVSQNRQAAGFQMEQFSTAKAQYHPICLNSRCYVVIAIRLNGLPLEAFKNSVFMSILGECALALENLRNAEEKEQASLMARNTGKVLTHTYITQNIWGRSWENDIASLRVFMVTLRKKLEAPPDSPDYIQTHIGVGYRMVKVD